MKTVAVILARGGSKGIPNKNFKNLNGRPLIYYAIKEAFESKVDEVWVSTDCPTIKWISEHLYARVLDRPEELATDESSSESALLHFSKSVDFDRMVFIQPTSPLLKAKYINQGLSMMDEYDSVFSVCREHFLPRWSLEVEPLNFDNDDRVRRQDREDTYIENGAFYITTKELLEKNKVRVSGNKGVVEMSPFESFQIDTMEDFNFIERLM